ncbi:MAG: hypothetical protein ACX930_02895 [Erythrobacter sp.]
MTPSKRTALIWWIGGLVAFGIVISLHIPLSIDAVPGGMLEHQRAPDADTVDAIQRAWQLAGVSDEAAVAMISDLVFIGIYGVGCVLAGLYFRSSEQVVLRALGWTALASGVVFLATDYGETIAQFIQLMRMQGDDRLAGFASSLGPAKVTSWIGGFLAVILALIAERFSTSGA